MEEVKVTAIVTKSIDYKEKDKLITIFSLELGLICATLKSVNSPNAKLKFASLPFCFAEFVLANKNGYYVVTECSQIESFYDIVTNYNKSIIGCFMLETSSIIMRNNMPDERWFIRLVTYLKDLAYSNCNAIIFGIKYCLELLKKIGYGIQTENCSICGLNFIGEVYLNLETGELSCEACKNINNIKLSKQEFAFLKIINITDNLKLNSIKANEELLKSLLLLLSKNLELRLNSKIKSLNF